MRNWLQRVRGAIGIGLTWAAAWAPIGAVTGWLLNVAVIGYPAGYMIANFALMFGILGFTGGAVFATILSVAERRRSFGELSLGRVAAWGGLGGMIPLGLGIASGLLRGELFSLPGAVIAGALMVLGSGSAASTLAIARAARSPASLGKGTRATPAVGAGTAALPASDD